MSEAAAVAIVGGEPAAGDPQGPTRTFWRDAWRTLRRRPFFWISLVLIVVFTLMALVPQLFVWPSPAPDDPSGVNCILREGRQAPSAEHWFGTDTQGCDYFAQVVYGARTSLRIAFGATLVTVLVGVGLGMVAGYYGRWPDTIISRLADGFFALPYLVGAIVVLSVVASNRQRTWVHVLLAIAFLGWPSTLRLFRSTVLQVKGLEYVQAARAMGAGDLRIMGRHILPNALAPVLVYTTVSMGAVIAVEATLSFLGVGLPLGSISWGIMIENGQKEAVAGVNLHLLLFPSIFLVLSSLAFVLMGEELREAFDPRSR
jgi:oligopeptide transport system permease protein